MYKSSISPSNRNLSTSDSARVRSAESLGMSDWNLFIKSSRLFLTKLFSLGGKWQNRFGYNHIITCAGFNMMKSFMHGVERERMQEVDEEG